jgi:hypothetical protein
MKNVSLLLMIGCLAGCGNKKQLHETELDQSHATIYYQEQEVKKRHIDNAAITVRHQKEIDVDAIELDQINFDYVWTVDIPVPIDAIEKRDYCQAKPDVYAVGYTASENQDDLIAFYKQQMELLGWHCWWDTQGLEALLMFEKPHKHCAVSIRPGSSRKKTDIIVMQKIV